MHHGVLKGEAEDIGHSSTSISRKSRCYHHPKSRNIHLLQLSLQSSALQIHRHVKGIICCIHAGDSSDEGYIQRIAEVWIGFHETDGRISAVSTREDVIEGTGEHTFDFKPSKSRTREKPHPLKRSKPRLSVWHEWSCRSSKIIHLIAT